jgi:hypothetical protein
MAKRVDGARLYKPEPSFAPYTRPLDEQVPKQKRQSSGKQVNSCASSTCYAIRQQSP